jgi:hypothetical protein
VRLVILSSFPMLGNWVVLTEKYLSKQGFPTGHQCNFSRPEPASPSTKECGRNRCHTTKTFMFSQPSPWLATSLVSYAPMPHQAFCSGHVVSYSSSNSPITFWLQNLCLCWNHPPQVVGACSLSSFSSLLKYITSSETPCWAPYS